MALPKEPRQKMINLMYLVLTALLALNVSSEILNAFKTVNNSLITANTIIEKKNQTIFSSFKELEKDEATKERALLWGDRAQSARTLAEDLNTYIEGLKTEILKAADFNPKDGSFKEDNLEAATRVMSDPGKKGAELKKKLEDFKTKILAIDDSINLKFKDALPIDLSTPKSNNSTSNDWASAYFHMTPTIAALTILSKFENDVKNSEAMVVEFCHQQVGTVQFVNDQYQPLVGQNSDYLMPDGQLIINAGIGSFNNAVKPQVTVDGAPAQLTPDGAFQYKTTVGGPGSYSKKVHITFFNQQKNAMDSRDYDVKYTVGSPTGASVSADDVKVLYVDLNNHLSINGGNVGAEKVHPEIDNGSLESLGNGKYVAHPAKVGLANVTLNIDGQSPQKFQFKVKNVPDPIAMVGGSKGGRMPANDFKSQSGVRADLENFVFEGIKFSVTSFTIVVTGGKKGFQYRQVTGNSFNPVTDIIESLGPNTNVTIDEIKVVGPGGIRDLPPITFNLY